MVDCEFLQQNKNPLTFWQCYTDHTLRTSALVMPFHNVLYPSTVHMHNLPEQFDSAKDC